VDVSARVVGVAFLIKFEEVEGETEVALEAAAGTAAEARDRRAAAMRLPPWPSDPP
jgi:hypothetical protein